MVVLHSVAGILARIRCGLHRHVPDFQATHGLPTAADHALAHQPVEPMDRDSTQQQKKSERKNRIGDQGEELHGGLRLVRLLTH